MFKTKCAGCNVFVFSGNLDAIKSIGLRSKSRKILKNGKIDSRLLHYPMIEGSALVKFGNTHVICNATVEKATPRWMQNDKTGWVTAEYGMLPRSTNERMNREAIPPVKPTIYILTPHLNLTPNPFRPTPVSH